MPLYEYECSACKKVHEIIQKFSDAPLTECPECKSPVEKLLSQSSFALKGSGWYTTDYKKSSAPKACEKSSSGECASSSCPSAVSSSS